VAAIEFRPGVVPGQFRMVERSSGDVVAVLSVTGDVDPKVTILRGRVNDHELIDFVGWYRRYLKRGF
jgi:hypothetical protein